MKVHIFIDESGGFIPRPGRGASASTIAGLVVPSGRRALLAREFKRFRKRVRPGSEELKGSSISEAEAAEFSDLLVGHGAILEVIAIDMGAHTVEMVEEFKALQAELVVESLDRDHHLTTVEMAVWLSEEIKRMPNQLFVQSFCSVQLQRRIFERARMYYSLRSPEELSSYSWQVDAKAERVTAMEHAWSLLALAVMTTVPTTVIPGGDYSREEQFTVTSDALSPPPGKPLPIDLGRTIRDRMSFVDSRASLGIQMADISAAIVSRALNDKLLPGGWMSLGKLLVKDRQAGIRVMALDTKAPKNHSKVVSNHPWHWTLKTLAESAQEMIPLEAADRVREAFARLALQQADSTRPPAPARSADPEPAR